MNDIPIIFRNQWLFGLLVGVVLLGLAEAGYHIGLRLYATRDEARRTQISGVAGSGARPVSVYCSDSHFRWR